MTVETKPAYCEFVKSWEKLSDVRTPSPLPIPPAAAAAAAGWRLVVFGSVGVRVAGVG
jgi:hypothetical protein